MESRIYLIGYMGCGKSTVGKLVAEKIGYTFIDLDGFIEEKYHKKVAEIFEEMGQDKFREIGRAALTEVSTFEKVIIATGGGAPCFFDNMKLMSHTGLSIYIYMSLSDLTIRLENSRPGKRPLIDGKKGDELRSFIESGLATREPFYTQATLTVEGPEDEIVEIVYEAIVNKKQ